MTPCPKNKCTFSAETRRIPFVRHYARSAIQAKAQPSLRTYDNNGNVVGCRNVDGIIAEDFKDALYDSLESLTIRSAKGRIDCEFVFYPFGHSKRKGNSP